MGDTDNNNTKKHKNNSRIFICQFSHKINRKKKLQAFTYNATALNYPFYFEYET